MLNKVFRLIVCLCGALVGYGITSFTARPEIFGESWGITPGQKVLWICTGIAFFAFIFDIPAGKNHIDFFALKLNIAAAVMR